MMIIGIYQYSWFLFAFKIQNDLGWGLASLGLVYTIFHYTSTLVMPFSGYIADSHGPRNVAFFAAILVGTGFILCAYFPGEWPIRFFYGIGGIGGGVLYGVSTATAIKWFPDRRGFATGLAVFGFGAGTAIFNIFIEKSLDVYGLKPTFLYLGIMMLVILLPLALVYRYPDVKPPVRSAPGMKPVKKDVVDFRPQEMLKTYQWYLIYFSFSFTISIVLIFGGQMKMLAKEYALPDGYFSLLLVLFPLANGLSRVLAGAVSDRIGRGRTMQIFYSLLGLSIFGLVWLGNIPFLFFMLVILAALLGGSPFALYPATIGDFYGPKFSTTNYGITYTAKAWAGLISGWLSGYLVSSFGTYTFPLLAVAVCSLIAALVSHPRLLKPPEKA
jgi:OFA family oxalate/formate antiporter-like MFS transporter